MLDENLFQIFSQVFIESQQSFNHCEADLRNKCRVLSQKLSDVVEDLERDVFKADVTKIIDLREEMNVIVKVTQELESRRSLIKDSVESLKKSTEKHVARSF